MLVWAVWPHAFSAETIAIRNPEAMAAGLPEKLDLRWPVWLRLGETGEVLLSLPARNTAGLPDVAQVEARLELAGVDISPGYRLIQTVTPGKPVSFRWQLTASQVGISEGTVWFFWATASGGQEQRLPILARQIKVKVGGFLGLPILAVWIVALVCMVVGVILFFFKGKRARHGRHRI